MFKMFMYEEMCQSGCLTLYILNNAKQYHEFPKVIALTREMAIKKGEAVLNRDAYMAPWTREPFRLFYLAAELTLRSYE